MRYRGTYPQVSLRELSRDCSWVLDRVRRGERLIVCRHGWPVATLQPLSGWIGQPLDGEEYDIHGTPLGDVSTEADKLSEAQAALLLDGISLGRIIPARLGDDYPWRELCDAIDDLVERGLARRGPSGGVVPTGRGIMLREHLQERAGVEPRDLWLQH